MICNSCVRDANVQLYTPSPLLMQTEAVLGSRSNKVSPLPLDSERGQSDSDAQANDLDSGVPVAKKR